MRLSVAVLLVLVACGPRERPTPEASPPDKAELFGDAALVPTRAGEHARRELAAAADLRGALRRVPGVDDVTVAVALPAPRRSGQGMTRAVIGVLARPEADAEAVRRRVHEVVGSWLGSEAVVEIAVDQPGAPPEKERPWLMIGLALLGLGASLGITIDRAADRLRTRGRSRR